MFSQSITVLDLWGCCKVQVNYMIIKYCHDSILYTLRTVYLIKF